MHTGTYHHRHTLVCTCVHRHLHTHIRKTKRYLSTQLCHALHCTHQAQLCLFLEWPQPAAPWKAQYHTQYACASRSLYLLHLLLCLLDGGLCLCHLLQHSLVLTDHLTGSLAGLPGSRLLLLQLLCQLSQLLTDGSSTGGTFGLLLLSTLTASWRQDRCMRDCLFRIGRVMSIDAPAAAQAASGGWPGPCVHSRAHVCVAGPMCA